MDMEAQLEISQIKVALGELLSEVIRLKETVKMTNRGCQDMLAMIVMLKEQNQILMDRLNFVESWAGAPNA